MTIEWMPRSRKEEDGWRDVRSGRAAPAPSLDVTGSGRGVRIPVVVRRYGRPRLPRLTAAMTFQVIRRGIGVGWALVWVGVGVWWFLHVAWWTPFLVAALVLCLVYRALRLQRFTTARRADLMLTPGGVEVGTLFVPWNEVDDVVRFNFMFGPGPGGLGARNYLALRVDDFVGVRGLSPFRAGLANLTRRRLVILAEASELHAPQALAAGLQRLVDDPDARRLLVDDHGVRLVEAAAA